MKLPTQVFVSSTKPEPHLITPITNEKFWKPLGGLWTSTLNDEGGAWVEWLHDQGYTLDMPRWGGDLWLLEPIDANICVIADHNDLRALHKRFPAELNEKLSILRSFRFMVDWEAVAREYDALHCPNPRAMRFLSYGSLESDDWEDSMSLSMFFDVMDAESTCWFRWCFEGEPAIHKLEPALGT